MPQARIMNIKKGMLIDFVYNY